MQKDLKVYIVIENPVTKKAVNISGNLAILREFLSGDFSLPSPQPTADPTPHPVRPGLALIDPPTVTA